MSEPRIAAAPIEPIFLDRWSRRAFASQPVSAQDLASAFEAARWAASCFNDQPWLFRYATAGRAKHDELAGVLAEGNRSWAQAAPVLGVVFTRRTLRRNDKPNFWAQFDAGAASAQFALQASALGLSAHFMAGFDPEAAYQVLGVDASEYQAMAAFALGHPGKSDTLPETLAERETPSDRFTLESIVQEVD